jgi:murein L,D-transpeptidase YcbB/YkuD
MYKQKIKFSLILLVLVATLIGCMKNQIEEEVEQPMSFTDSLHLENQLKFEKTQASTTFFIRRFLEEREPDSRYILYNQELYSSQLIGKAYQSNGFNPLWFFAYDSTERLAEMLEFVQSLEHHGLIPSDYHLNLLEMLTDTLNTEPSQIFDATFLGNLDLLLTDAYFIISSQLYHGKVDQELVKEQWKIQRNKKNLPFEEILSNGLQNSSSLKEMFSNYYPNKFGYELMVRESEKLKSMLGVGGEKIEFEQNVRRLKLGDTSATLVSVKKTLDDLGYLENTDSVYLSQPVFDSILVDGIKLFQKNFGFIQNGQVSRQTLNYLNLSIEEKLNKLYVNMERMRWLPENSERRYIMVNIADNTLVMMDEKDTVIQMKMIVGREYRKTPIFYAPMKYLVFSPIWTVPPGILRNDIIPAVRRNSNYLNKKNMYVTDLNGNILNPSSVNWRNTGSYRVRQRPGASNALGLVKFMFPNSYNVYLHDTPDKNLFDRETHAFSSGCIRVQQPAELAYEILKHKDDWDMERVKQNMNRGRETMVFLDEEIGVYLFYLTAYGNGEVNYREDIYKMDGLVLNALKKRKK